jgi:hypothetical protein
MLDCWHASMLVIAAVRRRIARERASADLGLLFQGKRSRYSELWATENKPMGDTKRPLSAAEIRRLGRLERSSPWAVVVSICSVSERKAAEGAQPITRRGGIEWSTQPSSSSSAVFGAPSRD